MTELKIASRLVRTWADRKVRRLAVLLDYGIAEGLHRIGLPGVACWFSNDGPGQALLQFGLRRKIEAMQAGCAEYRWDLSTNTVERLK